MPLGYDYDIHYKPGKINENADFLNRSINYVTRDKTQSFSKFQKYHQQMLEVKEPPNDKTSISKIKNFVNFLDCDTLDSNLHLDYLKNHFPQDNLVSNIVKETKPLKLPVQSIYIIYIKNFTVYSADHTTLYNTLENLKGLLGFNKTTSFTVVDITLQNDKIKKATFHSLLQYCFSNFTYKILANERLTLLSKEEIELVLVENHNNQYSFKENDQVLLHDFLSKNTNKKLSKNSKVHLK